MISYQDFYKTCLEQNNKRSNKHDHYWNTDSYLTEHSLRLYNSFRFIVKLTKGQKGLRLLSLGAGNAFVELCLSRYMDYKCTVLDFPGAIEDNKNYYDELGFVQIAADISQLETLKVDDPFDVVISLENIEHIPDAPSRYIKKFVSAIATSENSLLSGGGYFMLSTPNMGSIAHLIRIMLMLPTLPTPEVTFGPVSPENDCHRREYMPCEIMEGMAKCGLSSFTVSYTNQSTAFCRYRASRPAMHNIKNSIFRAFLTNFTPCLMSLFGLIPRFRYSMLVAGRKI